MTQDVLISRAVAADDRAACNRLRFEVFVDEQSVPPDIELDEHEDTALHFLARLRGVPVGTARVVFKDPRAAKIGRVAVCKTARGCGIGAALMQAVEADPALRDTTLLMLEAQVHAVGFYQRLGYTASGAVFMDAGIPHRTMHKVRSGRRSG
jgi:predicted GNAT family N-acyltransferase